MLAQLSKKEWESQVKDALKSWYEPENLERHLLTELRIVSQKWESAIYANDAYRQAKALREVMRIHITRQAPEPGHPDIEQEDDPRWMQRRWRYHNILRLLPRYSVGEIAQRIGLALAGQYYREQRKAIAKLAETIREEEGNPIDAASTARSFYPAGAVQIDDPFYIERESDHDLRLDLAGDSKTITIRGSRQVGKTSLLIRGIDEAVRLHNAHVIYLDLQEFGEEVFESIDVFLRAMAEVIFDELDLDLNIVQKAWRSSLQPQRKIERLLKRYVLEPADTRVLLAMDEIDSLQFTPFCREFFKLIRKWHDKRAPHNSVWRRLIIMMSISTEPYLLIEGVTSPFNVSKTFNLKDFDAKQVADLNNRYGSPLAIEELPQMMQLLNGHPYLTRIALYTLVIAKLSWAEFIALAWTDESPFRQHLEHQYRLLMKDKALRNTLREIVRGQACSDENTGLRLLKAGLVTKAGARYACRCHLYQQYFADRL